ncbi:serine/threonine protein kinase [Mycobacterium kansasii]|nr:serine/threonine protein kinase [Mycobacterium kansasii]
MGAVYLAADPTLPRAVALKVLSAELCRDPEFRARFIREADTAAGLEHPQIVSVYNRGQTDAGQLWIAMQFIDGTDADAALRAGAMTPHRALHIITEVAKALDFAHAHHIIHRDIKPANFLLSGPPGAAERVYLGDFGIARALDDAGLTATGSVVATVAYAAPEVLSNAPIDHRADIYSLGCTLYRLLTGHTPYPATNGAAGVMAAHLFSPPPRVTDQLPTLAAALDHVIAVAMAKDPAARFPSASALADAATAALHDPSPHHPLPAVPSGEVVSYPTSSPAPVWWQHSGPRTMASPGPPLSSVPHARKLDRTVKLQRRRGVVIGASLAAAVLLAATITLTAWPDHTTGDPSKGGSAPAANGRAPEAQGPPATDITGPQLRPILLTANEIAHTTGGQTVSLETDTAAPFNDGDTVDNPQCLGAWAPAQQTVYASTGYTDMATQTLRAINQSSSQDGITQAVIAYPSQDKAAAAYVNQRGQWALCGGTSLTVAPAGQSPQTWDFAQPVTTSGVLTLAATLRGSATTCQHAILARGNVLIDLRQCRPTSANVTALAIATAAKIPRR